MLELETICQYLFCFVCRWALAFRDAFSFRSSHYFVSYLSETSSYLSGLEIGEVARPSHIEMPRSLVEVVVYWNMPMHYWLKTCKFDKFLSLESLYLITFFFTYFCSFSFMCMGCVSNILQMYTRKTPTHTCMHIQYMWWATDILNLKGSGP